MDHEVRRFARRRALAACAALAVAGLTGASPAAAQTEVRFAQQFGLLYLPLQVVIDQKMVEKHAAKAGLKDVTGKMIKLSGAAAVNRALLSGNVEFACGGVGGLLTIWDKTTGTPDEVRAAVDIAKMPLKLLTNDPEVKTFNDYLKVSNHKIATPSVVSIQAVTLRMAAVKYWGPGSESKIESLLVNMTHPTAVAAMLSSGQTVKSHFATLPYSYEELKTGKVRLVMNSFDFLGGPHSIVSLYGTTKWKNANPKLYKVVVDAFTEAMEFINADLGRAAQIYVDFTKSKLAVADVKAMISSKDEMQYDIVPRGTMQYAIFLHKAGTIQHLPKSWKDYYFENVHGMEGS
ncbi:MAG: ABC transporter substrate-binding protein [Burkholderiales bacterium]|nr:ABC transporter substrate-binding protein [Burkholderiales bacterium]